MQHFSDALMFYLTTSGHLTLLSKLKSTQLRAVSDFECNKNRVGEMLVAPTHTNNFTLNFCYRMHWSSLYRIQNSSYYTKTVPGLQLMSAVSVSNIIMMRPWFSIELTVDEEQGTQ